MQLKQQLQALQDASDGSQADLLAQLQEKADELRKVSGEKQATEAALAEQTAAHAALSEAKAEADSALQEAQAAAAALEASKEAAQGESTAELHQKAAELNDLAEQLAKAQADADSLRVAGEGKDSEIAALQAKLEAEAGHAASTSEQAGALQNKLQELEAALAEQKGRAGVPCADRACDVLREAYCSFLPEAAYTRQARRFCDTPRACALHICASTLLPLLALEATAVGCGLMGLKWDTISSLLAELWCSPDLLLSVALSAL